MTAIGAAKKGHARVVGVRSAWSRIRFPLPVDERREVWQRDNNGEHNEQQIPAGEGRVLIKAISDVTEDDRPERDRAQLPT